MKQEQQTKWTELRDQLKQYKLTKEQRKQLFKKKRVRIEIIIILLILRFGLTGSVFFGVKSYRDVRTVKEMIQELNANGSDITTDLNDTDVYRWNLLTGRLMAITWDKCSLNAKEISFEKLGGLVWLNLSPNTEYAEEMYVERTVEKLNLKKNKCLMFLNCYGFGIDNIDVSGCPFLVFVSISGISTDTLDLSHNKLLWDVRCTRSDIKKINLKGVFLLNTVICDGNNLQELNVESNPFLTYLDCSMNQGLKKLDVSKNKALKELECGTCELEELKLGKNNRLEKVWCSSNNLKEIDISKCKNLRWIKCARNQLTKLDTSKNKKLATVECEGNNIMELNFSKNKEMFSLSCDKNTRILGLPKTLKVWDDIDRIRAEGEY